MKSVTNNRYVYTIVVIKLDNIGRASTDIILTVDKHERNIWVERLHEECKADMLSDLFRDDRITVLLKRERTNVMTISEIIMAEIKSDLGLYKEYRARWKTTNNKTDLEYYLGASKRSWHRVEAKCDLARSLGYTVLFDDEDAETMEVIAVYPKDFDD